MSPKDHPSICFFHTGPASAQMLLKKGAPHAGGAELQLTLIARALASRGWTVSFVFDGHNMDFPDVTPDGIRLLSTKKPVTGLPLIRFFTQRLPQSMQLIQEANADIYLQRGVGWQNALVARACEADGRRFVLWLASYADVRRTNPWTSPLPWHERWVASYGVRRSDIIVAQTYRQRKMLRETIGREAEVISNVWPAIAPWQPPPSNPPVVFWAARIIPLKRPHLFLNVAQNLSDIHFVMAGGAEKAHEDLFQSIKQRSEGMENVDFLGFVPFAEIDQYYAQCSAYLCTSTVEGFPNTFLQAWSHGRPVVTTFDPDGIVANNNLGFYCDNTDAIAGAVEKACAISETYGERVRRYLRDHHLPDVIVPKIEAVLQR